jgi:hypothetical protein
MLKIFHGAEDISREQSRFEYLTSNVSIFYNTLSIGFYKPVNSLYFNVIKNDVVKITNLKYFNGISFEDVTGLKDLTFGLSGPGFISWKNGQISEAKTEVEGVELYWYQVTVEDSEPIDLRGIGPLFSDDYDLIGIYPTILNHLPEGQNTFVRFHEEAARDIIIDLRRTGLVINGRLTDAAGRKQIDAFDLLDKEEVRDAAKYFALSKIFSWLSDSPGDKWENLASKYEAEAAGSLTPLITLDQNDNGIIEDYEEAADMPVIVGRL